MIWYGFCDIQLSILKGNEKRNKARKRMVDQREKRKYRRLEAQFDLSFHQIGSTIRTMREGRSVNISPGGVYFLTTTNRFKQGDVLKVELSIPPKPGLLEFGGKMAGFAKVLRTDYSDSSLNDVASKNRFGIALEFCHPLRLCL